MDPQWATISLPWTENLEFWPLRKRENNVKPSFLQITTSLLDSLAQCPVENMASAIVPMELVGLAGTKVTPPGDGEVGDGEVGDGGGNIDDDFPSPPQFLLRFQYSRDRSLPVRPRP